MTRRAGSGRAFGLIVAMAAGVALAGCIGQVNAHPVDRPAPVAEDRDLDGVGHGAYLVVAAVPTATPEPPPFVCEIMDMDAGATDGTPAADRTSRLLATGP